MILEWYTTQFYGLSLDTHSWTTYATPPFYAYDGCIVEFSGDLYVIGGISVDLKENVRDVCIYLFSNIFFFYITKYYNCFSPVDPSANSGNVLVLRIDDESVCVGSGGVNDVYIGGDDV